MDSGAEEHGTDGSSIYISQLKNRPSKFVMERLKRAVAEGVRVLDVINRGKPVCHLALAEDLPAEWRVGEPATVPLNELKRSEIKLSALRREGRALYLSQRNGPTLALWPVADTYVRPANLSLSDEVDYLRREVNRLRRRVERLERLERALAAFGTLMAKTFSAKPEISDDSAELEEDM
jgi:hypothetical protein